MDMEQSSDNSSVSQIRKDTPTLIGCPLKTSESHLGAEQGAWVRWSRIGQLTEGGSRIPPMFLWKRAGDPNTGPHPESTMFDSQSLGLMLTISVSVPWNNEKDGNLCE